ncbi:ATP-binding protein [Brevundimonas aurantiaca]|uniref:ATP-binding protein n=1 Tax=Brevundimonas aurantiaca TaxID=74316 RepID=UPI001D17F53E|nr:ATP-binding protein [Brevundimonas aurantiaca]MCC4295081.1 response regulator [Brevundimonas aurantiaca]
MIQKADYIRAYADRYRDMFAVRLTTIVAVILVAAWVLDWGWAANFGLIQLGLYVLLWRTVEIARTRPEAPGAGRRFRLRTEWITLGLASHNAVYILAAWWVRPDTIDYLRLLLAGNLMVGALQVHISRRSFLAAVAPPSIAAMIIAAHQPQATPTLKFAVALFVLGIIAAAWRQWRGDRETVELMVALTERSRQLQAALGQAETDRAAAERANKAKSRFLAMISHEVRTPLNVILGLTEVLRGRRRPKAEAVIIDDMAEAGGMLLRLLNGALDISKIESGHSDLQIAPVDVAARIEAIARVWRTRVAELGLTLEVVLDGDPADFAVLTDQARVEQVLINYLSNALKLTPAGTIRLVAQARPQIDGRVDLSLEVHDRGPGVPEDQRERIFQPFEQLAAGRAAGGAGLGLALCRAAAEGLGGSVGVRPAEGAGAVFWFRFTAPRAPVEADAEAAPPAPTPDAPPALRVLAAEDHPANRKLLALLFQSFGLDLALVENGRNAVDALRADRFDLVLMDAMMPVMDGVEAVRLIRAEEAAEGRPRTPIHMLTANVFEDDVARYRAAGADGVLGKPIQIGVLQALLEQTAASAVPA